MSKAILMNMLGLGYMIGIAGLAVGGLYLTGWVLWSAGSPPDDSPFAMLLGLLASMALAFSWGHYGLHLIAWITRRAT